MLPKQKSLHIVFMKADNGVKNNNQYSSRCAYNKADKGRHGY